MLLQGELGTIWQLLWYVYSVNITIQPPSFAKMVDGGVKRVWLRYPDCTVNTSNYLDPSTSSFKPLKRYPSETNPTLEIP